MDQFDSKFIPLESIIKIEPEEFQEQQIVERLSEQNKSETTFNDKPKTLASKSNKRLRVKWGPYTCCLCQKVFNKRETLLGHLYRVHQEGETFSCDLCPKFYFSKCSIAHHTNQIHKIQSFTCSLCNFKTSLKHILMNHHKSKHKYQKTKDQKVEFPKHRETKEQKVEFPKHRQTKDQKVECPTCKQQVSSLEIHMIVHMPRKSCPVCHKMVAESHMNEHMKNHLHKCKICEEFFDKKEALKRWVLMISS